MIAILKVFGEIQYKHIVSCSVGIQMVMVITQNSVGYLLTLGELNIGFEIGNVVVKTVFMSILSKIGLYKALSTNSL